MSKIFLSVFKMSFWCLQFRPKNERKQVDLEYSHFSINRGGWNCKRVGGAKVAKSINMEGGIFWKKPKHKCNKPGVEGGKNLRNQ